MPDNKIVYVETMKPERLVYTQRQGRVTAERVTTHRPRVLRRVGAVLPRLAGPFGAIGRRWRREPFLW